MLKAYEQALPGGIEAGGMRLVVSPVVAWASRTLYLPWMLRTRRFPRNAPAPREVRPDADVARTMPRTALIQQLEDTANRAALALRSAREDARVTHAYFGALTPLVALRLLNAHTRHHTGLPPR